MIDDITKRRWDKDDNPNNHSVETALKIAMDDALERRPDHVIVMMAKHEPEDGRSYWHVQAGKYDGFSQIGMITQILNANWLNYGA